MTTTIVLVRHGQSTWNSANLFTGWVDVPLTSIGEFEAQQTALTLMHLGFDRFDAFYSSPLERAIETVNIISHSQGVQQPDIQIDNRLLERHNGAATGENKTTWQANDPGFADWHRGTEKPPRILDDFHNYHPNQYPYGIKVEGGSESVVETGERFEQALNYIAIKHPHQTILVGSHNNAMRGGMYKFVGHDDQSIRSVVFQTGQPAILTFDETGSYQDLYLPA